jgi:hypothetical protein
MISNEHNGIAITIIIIITAVIIELLTMMMMMIITIEFYSITNFEHKYQ